uniref:Uncharacterized protein n=1 Tax=Timema poppense TaxID=170557 RepID=A0A7R9DHQ7_TIMPO|nr:unnamed protein product [Timema poppensis]
MERFLKKESVLNVVMETLLRPAELEEEEAVDYVRMVPTEKGRQKFVVTLYAYEHHLCGLVVRVPGYISIAPGLDPLRFQIVYEAVCLEQGQLSLMKTNEELLELKKQWFRCRHYIRQQMAAATGMARLRADVTESITFVELLGDGQPVVTPSSVNKLHDTHLDVTSVVSQPSHQDGTLYPPSIFRSTDSIKHLYLQMLGRFIPRVPQNIEDGSKGAVLTRQARSVEKAQEKNVQKPASSRDKEPSILERTSECSRSNNKSPGKDSPSETLTLSKEEIENSPSFNGALTPKKLSPNISNTSSRSQKTTCSRSSHRYSPSPRSDFQETNQNDLLTPTGFTLDLSSLHDDNESTISNKELYSKRESDQTGCSNSGLVSSERSVKLSSLNDKMLPYSQSDCLVYTDNSRRCGDLKELLHEDLKSIHEVSEIAGCRDEDLRMVFDEYFDMLQYSTASERTGDQPDLDLKVCESLKGQENTKTIPSSRSNPLEKREHNYSQDTKIQVAENKFADFEMGQFSFRNSNEHVRPTYFPDLDAYKACDKNNEGNLIEFPSTPCRRSGSSISKNSYNTLKSDHNLMRELISLDSTTQSVVGDSPSIVLSVSEVLEAASYARHLATVLERALTRSSGLNMPQHDLQTPEEYTMRETQSPSHVSIEGYNVKNDIGSVKSRVCIRKPLVNVSINPDTPREKQLLSEETNEPTHGLTTSRETRLDAQAHSKNICFCCGPRLTSISPDELQKQRSLLRPPAPVPTPSTTSTVMLDVGELLKNAISQRREVVTPLDDASCATSRSVSEWS